MHLFIICLVGIFVGANSQFTSTGITAILNAHNTLRSKIAKGTYVVKGFYKPSASNMLKMTWDTTVAASAQAYANTCPTGHSHAPGLGENLYWYYSSATYSDLQQFGTFASQSWSNEFQTSGWSSNYLDVTLFNTGIGHATQMAWANTGSVGCGIRVCPDGSWNKVTVVCQYKAQGNMLNSYIYKTGSTCSACPSGTSCESSTGLCSSSQSGGSQPITQNTQNTCNSK